jgi:hypothetical protein
MNQQLEDFLGFGNGTAMLRIMKKIPKTKVELLKQTGVVRLVKLSRVDCVEVYGVTAPRKVGKDENGNLVYTNHWNCDQFSKIQEAEEWFERMVAFWQAQ